MIINPFNVEDYIMNPDLSIEEIVEEISKDDNEVLSPQGIDINIFNQK